MISFFICNLTKRECLSLIEWNIKIKTIISCEIIRSWGIRSDSLSSHASGGFSTSKPPRPRSQSLLRHSSNGSQKTLRVYTSSVAELLNADLVSLNLLLLVGFGIFLDFWSALRWSWNEDCVTKYSLCVDLHGNDEHLKPYLCFSLKTKQSQDLN